MLLGILLGLTVLHRDFRTPCYNPDLGLLVEGGTSQATHPNTNFRWCLDVLLLGRELLTCLANVAKERRCLEV